MGPAVKPCILSECRSPQIHREVLEGLWSSPHPFEDTLSPAAAILCAGGPDVIRKEAWFFYRTISSVHLCWELAEPKGPKGVSALSEGIYLGIQGYLARKKTQNPQGPP